MMMVVMLTFMRLWYDDSHDDDDDYDDDDAYDDDGGDEDGWLSMHTRANMYMYVY